MPNKLTISDMKNLAKEFGGTFISKKYSGTREPHLWKCHKEDHPSFARRPDKVKYERRWCPICELHIHRDNENNLEVVKQFAIRKGGKCLSKQYVDSKINLDWECKNGHRFSETWSNVKDNPGRGEHGRSRGIWCNTCNNENWQAVENLATKIGGKVISKKSEYTRRGKINIQIEHEKN